MNLEREDTSNYDLMRPEEFYGAVLQQREIDGFAFYNKYKDLFVSVGCPACGIEGEFAFSKFGFSHNICTNCSTLYCSPRPGDDLLSIFYNTYESVRMWTTLLIQAETERKVLQYGPRAEHLVAIIKSNGTESGGTAFDLGCGSGAFMRCLENTGFFKEVIGQDLSTECVNICKERGLKAIHGKLSDLKRDSVDLLCMNDLLEHVFDPASFIKGCREIIRPGGFISICTPNGEGFDFKLLKENTKNISPPEHLNYFNPDSMELLLHRAGFECVSIETPGRLDVDIVLKEKANGYRITDTYIDFLLQQKEDVLFNLQKFISENKLSSHMLVVARQKQ